MGSTKREQGWVPLSAMLESIREMIKPFLCEFIGTTIFLSCISWTLWGANMTGAPLAPFVIGSSLMVVVYFGGSISGGHFNPAVTLAIFLTSSTIWKSRSHVEFGPIALIGYWTAQILAAFFAGGMCFAFQNGQVQNDVFTKGDTYNIGYVGYPTRGCTMAGSKGVYPMSGGGGGVSPSEGPISWGTAMAVEMFGTMTLVLVVLNVATVSSGAANAGNSTFGMAIGGVITAWAVGGGWISGGAFNPAVGCLPLVWGETNDVGIYWVGPILGSLMGTAFFMLTNPAEFTEGEPSDMLKHAKDCINEYIGTFLFVLLISLAAGSGSSLAGLAIGTMLMCMVYMGGHISGGHYNPAVTLSVWIRGKAPWWKCGLYILVQSIGALCAGGISRKIFDDIGGSCAGSPVAFGTPAFGWQKNLPDTDSNLGTQYPFGTAWFVELFGTFILCSTVLASATCDNKNQNNSYYGLAIGFSVVISAYSFGWVSGGAFNPAVGLLPLAAPDNWSNGGSMALMNMSHDRWKYWLCYWTAPFFAAAFAALFFWILNPDEGYFMHPEKVHKPGQSGEIALAQGGADKADASDFAAEGDNEDPLAVPDMGDNSAVMGDDSATTGAI